MPIDMAKILRSRARVHTSGRRRCRSHDTEDGLDEGALQRWRAIAGKASEQRDVWFVRYRDGMRTLLPWEERTPLHTTRQKRDEAGAPPPVTLPTLYIRVARQV